VLGFFNFQATPEATPELLPFVFFKTKSQIVGYLQFTPKTKVLISGFVFNFWL
jgi:hypothetical protein